MMWLLGYVFFFELGDINSFSFAAPAILASWKLSISTIGFITSATFVRMFVGATTGGWFSDRVGRKRRLATTIIVFGFLVALLQHVYTPLLYAYTPECYPSEIRNSGAGLAYGGGRLANVSGPLVVAFLSTHHGYTSVFVYIATCWVLVAIAVGGFGPLRKGRTLT